MSNKQDYDFYKSIGICPQCRKRPAEPNKVLCLECAEMACVHDQNKRKRHLEHVKKLDLKKYYRLKEQGICTYCKHEKSIPGKTKCKKCLAKIRYKRQQNRRDLDRSEWVAHGICYQCGKNQVLPGKGVCSECYKIRLIAINKCLESRQDGFNEYWKQENRVTFGGTK